MQAAHQAVTFEYDRTTTVTFDCEWTTGTRNVTPHVNSKTVTEGIKASVESASRKTGQWTGWNLPDALPADADAADAEITDADCGSEGNEMKSVFEGSVKVAETSGGGLYAVLGGVRHLLTPTA